MKNIVDPSNYEVNISYVVKTEIPCDRAVLALETKFAVNEVLSAIRQHEYSTMNMFLRAVNVCRWF
jgi:hypothetical protein